MNECASCGTEMISRCPCGRAECNLFVLIPVCPKCDAEAFKKRLKMTGTPVCQYYLKKQFGEPL